MTVLRGFVITIASGLAFAAVGGGLGFALGKYAPDYYRVTFRIPPDIKIEPWQAGLGLGLTQGLATGLIVGLVIVVAVAWSNSRSISPSA